MALLRRLWGAAAFMRGYRSRGAGYNCVPSGAQCRVRPRFPHARLLRGRRPLQGRDDPRRQRRVAAGRGRFRQAPEDQGRDGAAALRRAVAGGAARAGAEARRRARPELPVGSVRDRGVRLRRARPRVLRARAAAGGGRGDRARAARRADVLLQARQGALPQGAARRAEGGAGVGRAQAARGRADRGLGRRARSAHRLPDALAREAADAALQARQERARVEGADGGLRRAARPTPSRCSRAAGRFPRRTTTTTSASSPKPFPQGTAFAAVGALRAVARTAAGAGARVLDRRPHDHRDRRRVLGARTCPTATYEVGIHIAAPALCDPARLRARRRRARAAVDRLHARAQDHDAARRGDRRVHAGRRRDGAGAVAVRRDRRATAAVVRHATRVNRVPIAANLRLDEIGDAFTHDLPAPRRSAAGTRNCACCGRLAQTLFAARGKADIDAHRLQLLRRLGRRTRRPRSPSCRGCAARRSTSSSPS